MEDLCLRVDDWKNHKVDHFGDLLLHGHFPVVTGKSDVQKEVRNLSSLITSPLLRQVGKAVRSKGKALLSNLSPSNLMFAFDHIDDSQWDTKSDNKPPTKSSHIDQRRLSLERQMHYYMANMEFIHFLGSNPITGSPLLAEQLANSLGITCPSYQQYTIYLFERILLCCKEVNPNKSKDKLMGTQKDKKDKKDKNKSKLPNKNAKLQLKGRIFMTNVTEVLSLAKQGTLYIDLSPAGLLTFSRFLHGSDLLERGPRGGELHYQILE